MPARSAPIRARLTFGWRSRAQLSRARRGSGAPGCEGAGCEAPGCEAWVAETCGWVLRSASAVTGRTDAIGSGRVGSARSRGSGGVGPAGSGTIGSAGSAGSGTIGSAGSGRFARARKGSCTEGRCPFVHNGPSRSGGASRRSARSDTVGELGGSFDSSNEPRRGASWSAASSAAAWARASVTHRAASRRAISTSTTISDRRRASRDSRAERRCSRATRCTPSMSW